MLLHSSEKQVMRIVGEAVASSNIRTDAILSIEKEKEGKFDMAAEEAAIAQQMAQMHQAMGVPPQNPQPQVIKDKKKKRR